MSTHCELYWAAAVQHVLEPPTLHAQRINIQACENRVLAVIASRFNVLHSSLRELVVRCIKHEFTGP